MKKFNSTCRIFLFLALCLSAGLSSHAQLIGSATVSNTYNGHSSDYYVQTVWQNFNVDSANNLDTACMTISNLVGSISVNNVSIYYFEDFTNHISNPNITNLEGVGPYTTRSYYLTQRIENFNQVWNFGCQSGIPNLYSFWESTPRVATTDYIHAPDSVWYTLDTLPTGIALVELHWTKGSDIPDGPGLYYHIWRDNDLIDSVPSTGALVYIDSAVLSNGTYNYYVASYTPGGTSVSASGTVSTSWPGGQEAYTWMPINFTDGILSASKGTNYGYTQLHWKNLSTFAPNDIEVLRDSQQIAIVNKNVTQYADYGGIPGVKYSYSIAPINAANQTPFQYADTGYGKPNGVMTGYIVSELGSGVPGVAVTAHATVDGHLYTYTDTTDATGYYTLNNIYYDSTATYTVVPSKGTDQFNPASISRTLTVQNYNNSLPNITDTTVFTISGVVRFAGTSCPVIGARLYVNGSYSGVNTDAGGTYRYTALQQGAYLLGVTYNNHTFDSISRTVNVVSSVQNINFNDTKTDTLVLDLKSGCSSQVVDRATFEVINDPTVSSACFDDTFTFDGFTPVTLVLPSMAYRVMIRTAINNGAPDLNYETTPNGPLDPKSVDLRTRDTTFFTIVDTSYSYVHVPNDTIPLSPTHDTIIYGRTDTIIQTDSVNTFAAPYALARFVTHGPLSIQLTNVDSFCYGYMVKQGVPFPMQIYVRETDNHVVNSVNHYTSCLEDTGQVRIYDGVSGAGLLYTNLVNGVVQYEMTPGLPNVPDNTTGPDQYKSLFEVHVNAGSQSSTLDAYMLIIGNKQLSAAIIDKTPPIPFMVLHDPPGSASYSTWEKDSSVSFNVTNLSNSSSTYGGYVGIQIGAVFTVPLTGLKIPGAYFNATVSGNKGTAYDNNTSQTMTMTANRVISTSSDPNYVGFYGDVFIGAAVDRKIAYAYYTHLDTPTCKVKVDTILTIGMDSMESTFIYSALEIRNTVIPQLAGFLTAAPDSQKLFFQSQINDWNNVLLKDSMNILTANYSQNITFSAGASYDYTVSSDSNFQNTYDETINTDINSTIGAGISNAELLDINAGATMEWTTNNTTQANGVTDQTTTFNYHLEDDIPGNVYSVSIGFDPSFGSPMFNVYGGTSACPWELGTQQRDVPTMTITPGEQDNVPPAAQAAFVAKLGNQSESQEARTYQVSVAPESNLDGATIKIGGQDITQYPASFTVPYASTLNAALTVEKGPFVADYDSLLINFSSSCDGNISVQVPITVHFQSTCSDVALAAPNDGWLANSNNNDTLFVSFTGFNASNPNLQEIGLQYRLAGSTQAWSQGPVIPLAQLTQQYVTVPFNITALPDGNYQIRAYASCGSSNGGNTYSATLSGVIDRASFSLYGQPQPANGILNVADNISITFNHDIDCAQTYERMKVTLTRADNGVVIPDSFSCYGNGLIIKTNPDSLLDNLDGVTLIASVDRVHDIHGNLLGTPVTWSFVVNRSKIFWSPGNAIATEVKGTAATITATMENVGVADTFSFTKIPSWLTITPGWDNHLLQGTPTVPYSEQMTFTASNSLNQGEYKDTIIAIAAGKREYFFVTLDVVTKAPNWTVNANNYQYSMNITANYSVTSANAPLSSDTRDIIAAFAGNECRGVGYITYNPSSNSYAAFLTAYSNSAAGDTFTFRMWDALPGIEYQAVERQLFVTDGSVGQPAAPLILHPAGEFQTITFAPGWNWFSLNVVAADMSPKNVLGSITGNNAAIVKNQGAYDQYTTAQAGWTGSLSTFNTNSSYMIDLDHADTLHFLGTPVTTASIVQIASGWNWVGFPRIRIDSAADYLANVNASTGDILKSQTQFTQYNANAWSGSLINMYPGEGYKLKTVNAFNFVIPPDRSLPSWNVNENQFEQNMTVTADLQFNGSSTTQSNFLVGAFANGVCVGTAQPEFLATQNIYRVFITIHGDSTNTNQPLSFKLYDTNNDVEYVPTYMPISIVPDTVVAKVEAAYVINVETTTGINALSYTDGFSLLQNVPNPFAKTTSISYTIPADGQVTLTLYDESGRLIRELVNGAQTAGNHTVSFEQDNLQAGVYFYQMRSGEFAKTRRMLILQ